MINIRSSLVIATILLAYAFVGRAEAFQPMQPMTPPNASIQQRIMNNQMQSTQGNMQQRMNNFNEGVWLRQMQQQQQQQQMQQLQDESYNRQYRR